MSLPVPPETLDAFRELVRARRFADAAALLGETPNPRLELALRQHWGMALIEGGDLLGAEPHLRRAAELAPDDANAQGDLAFLQMRLGNYVLAEQTLRRTIALDPNNLGAVTNLGSALKALRRWGEAETMYRRALEIAPADGPAFINLGALLINSERFGEALALADQHAWRGAGATLLRAEALARQGRNDEALAACDAAEAQGADPYEVGIRRGLALAGMTRYREALTTFDAAVAQRSDASLARFRRALVRLMTGDFAGGWADFEQRWRDEAFLATSAPLIMGQIRSRLALGATRDQLVGKRVLLLAEQGIGDELMFASMIPDLVAIAASVTYVCEPRLAGLLSDKMPGARFVGARGARIDMSEFDVILPIGSLGLRFRDTLASFPGTPYAAAGAQARQRWAERLGPAGGRMRIGVSWRGGTSATRASVRSIDLSLLASAFGPECDLVSLQYGDAGPDLAVAAAQGVDLISFPPNELADFEDLAGLMESLDLVVSVQNATVHLAGAIGKPCLALLPHSPEWRYMAEGESMPWYSSVRLVRQERPGDWSSVLRRVTEIVGAWPRGAAQP